VVGFLAPSCFQADGGIDAGEKTAVAESPVGKILLGNAGGLSWRAVIERDGFE
jgi:hypothetical protein